MRYIAPDPNDDWELFELAKGKRRPCSDVYAGTANNKEVVQILSQLSLLIAAGCPPDLERGNPNIQKVGKCQPSLGPQPRPKSIDVYVLKVYPSRWRLYFVVPDRSARRILFVYAVSKKKNNRDPKDFAHCCHLLVRWMAGDYSTGALELPA